MSSFRRRLMIANAPYRLIDYIVNSNQNSRIITNCAPLNDNNYKFEVDCYVEARDTSREWGMIFANAGTDSINKKWRVNFNNSDKMLRALLNSNSNQNVYISNTSSYVGKRLFITLTSTQFKVNNQIANASGNKGGTWIADNFMQINEDTNNAPIIRYYAINAYYNNNLIHQYKPCITSNDVYTMVDVLSGYICEVKGNAWSGN